MTFLPTPHPPSLLSFEPGQDDAPITGGLTLRSQFGDLYDLVVGQISADYWSDRPELAIQHSLPMERFIRDQQERKAFVNRHHTWSRRHRQEDGIPRALHDLVSRCSKSIDIYVRRYVETDFTCPYFELTSDFEEACLIAWIRSSLSVMDYHELTEEFRTFEPGDEIFAFCAPPYAWENGFGRQGIVVLRGQRIVEEIVLEAS